MSGNFFRIEKDNKDKNKISISIPFKENKEEMQDFPKFNNKFIVGK